MKHRSIGLTIRILSILSFLGLSSYHGICQCDADNDEKIVSGNVFSDRNENGIEDLSDDPISGIDIFIYHDVNQNGVQDVNDILLSVETTDGDGEYEYTFEPVVQNIRDEFSGAVFNGAFNNNGTNDWVTDFWIRDGSNGSNQDVYITNGGDSDYDIGSQSIHFQDFDAGMYRIADLSTATTATLSFDYDWNDTGDPSLDGGELFFIQIDPENDGTYIDLDTIVFVDLPIGPTSFSTDIPPSLLGSATTRLRLATEDNINTRDGESWWIDNVDITFVQEITHFVIVTDPNTFPGAFALTTDNIEVAVLPDYGTCDDENKFGLKRCLNNCPPLAGDDAGSALQGVPITLELLANDIDQDGIIDTSSIRMVSLPFNGSVTLDTTTGILVYTPNGSFVGDDIFSYEICDNNSPDPLCDVGIITVEMLPDILDICAVANIEHTFYLPYPAEFLYSSLRNASSCPGNIDGDLRTVVSIKAPYPGAIIFYDHWEDDYESDEYSPTQASTEVWGDGDLTNGIAPGFPDDLIPAGGNIILDNQFAFNPRNQNNIFFDGKDRISTNSNVAISYIAGEEDMFEFQTAKTDVYDLDRFGEAFTVPFGENLGGVFQYTALYVRAQDDGTIVNLDLENDGVIDTTVVINQGEVFYVDGGIEEGALITASQPVGVDLLFGGIDCFGTRNVNLYPATFYSDTYYTPVPTTAAANPVSVYFYNSLNRDIDIDWTSNTSSGTFTLPSTSSFEFVLPDVFTAYRFENQSGDAYTAVSVVDIGSAYDWSFNLISADQLTNFGSIAWAPGSEDGTENFNPVWVTPVGNTTVYVKYDGNLGDQSAALSPCGIPFDDSFALDELDVLQIFDSSDNDQSGLSVFTCDGTSIVAVYGEDPALATAGGDASVALDVGTTIQPQCIEPAIFSNNDTDTTLIGVPVITEVLANDFAFLTNIDPSSVAVVFPPSDGTTTVNPDGTVTYFPDPGFFGTDTYIYRVCATDDPGKCDFATVTITIFECLAIGAEKFILGKVFDDLNESAMDEAENGVEDILIYFYHDQDEDGILDPTEPLLDSQRTDGFGIYRQSFYPFPVASVDDFSTGDYSGGIGDVWLGDWIESENNGPNAGDNQIVGQQLRLNDNGQTLDRNIDLSNTAAAFLSFDYIRDGMDGNDRLDVRISTNGGGSWTTVFQIFGNGGTDANFLSSGLVDLTGFIGGNAIIRLDARGRWNGNIGNDDLYVDNFTIIKDESPTHFIAEIQPSSFPDRYILTTSNIQTSVLFLPGTCDLDVDFGIVNFCAVGVDTDEDGLRDLCDIDDDNDGIPDKIENEACGGIPAVSGYDAFWNYENSTDDGSVNDYDEQNSVAESYSSNAIVGNNALELDGSYFVRYSDGTFLNQAIANFTYSFWFNPQSLSGTQFLIEEGGGTNGFAIRLVDNELQARVKEGTTILDAENFEIPDIGLWYHVAVSFSNGNFTFYLNGQAQAEVTSGIASLDAHGDHSGFGGNNGGNVYASGGFNNFTGLMDQVIHYPMALDSFQVDTLYHVCDTDLDGIPNSLDLDSDNDGLLDAYEAGHVLLPDGSGRISDVLLNIGENGLDDRLETSADNGIINYNPSDSEDTPDGMYDPYELDSDDDLCFDAREESIVDPDLDGIAGTGIAVVDENGMVISAKPYGAPPNNQWQDASMFSACDLCIDPTLLDSDGDGINDICDLDDDNDGIPDADECFLSSEGLDGLVTADAFYLTGDGGNAPVILDSIEVNGTVYTTLILPDLFDHDFSGNPGIDPNDVRISLNGAIQSEYTTSSDWNADALPSFQNLNMNHYQYINFHDMADGIDYFEVAYFTGIAVNEAMFVTVSERTGNNAVQVQALDNLRNPLGPRFDVGVADYQDSGVNINPGNENLEFFTIPLDDLAPYGSRIYYLRIYDNDPSDDSADLKVIIFGNPTNTCADTDGDGIVNALDLDSDNDGILDVYEAGHGLPPDASGRIANVDANIGTNGLDDRLETGADSDIINYNISDSETSPDGMYDPYELDSDGDGCFDATEEEVVDLDGDGIAGSGVPLVDTVGLVNVIKPYVIPPNDIWQDATIFGTACGCKIARTNPHVHYYRPKY